MSDEDALLAAIIANPDEDTPRLVYADWLDENGQAERAEFIRLQIQSATLLESGANRLVIQERLRQLLNQNGLMWLQPMGLSLDQVQWTRGFVDLINVTPKSFAKLQGRLFALGPVRFLAVVPDSPEYEQIELANGERAQVKRESCLDVEEFAKWPELAQIHTLWLSKVFIGDEGICTLVESPFISNLRDLYLRRNDIFDEGVSALANSSNLKSLRCLTLVENCFSVDGAFALARSPYLEQLESLNVAESLLDTEPAYGQAIDALVRRFGKRVDVGFGRD